MYMPSPYRRVFTQSVQRGATTTPYRSLSSLGEERSKGEERPPQTPLAERAARYPAFTLSALFKLKFAKQPRSFQPHAKPTNTRQPSFPQADPVRLKLPCRLMNTAIHG